jgi:L1 cell adhesion molecule like protein
MNEYEPFIGIDLGTTVSCVGTWYNGKVEMITNEHGYRTTPSYVSFDGVERYIGEYAKNNLASNPSNTVYDAKRLIGRKFSDKVVQEDIDFYSFKIIQGQNDNSEIQVEYCEKQKTFKPEQISAMILEKLKQDAEKFLGKTVTKAVITVPAYFNDEQKQATINAGKIAGLDVLRIINEPTAAALAYNIQCKKGLPDRHVLVYDLGGGTLDVTILIMSDGVLEVKSTAGDTHLGGEDFDKKLVSYCSAEFAKKTFKPKTNLSSEEIKKLTKHCKVATLNDVYRYCEEDLESFAMELSDKLELYLREIINIKVVMMELSGNPKLIGKLKKVCEDGKKVLSINESANISSDSFYCDAKGKLHDLKVTITREKFEQLCESDFVKCLEPVDRALKDSGLSTSQIDDVVLIGGSTRVPKIKQLLTQKFGNKLKADINPDEAVAYGATVQAAIIEKVNDQSITDIVLMDVIPLTLGIETFGGSFDKLLKRNTPIPNSAERTYSTATDNQSAVTIKIFEGEREMTKENNLLGQFEVGGIPPMRRGHAKIKVKFSVDVNGLMCVDAHVEGTDSTGRLAIKNDKGRLSEKDIERMITEGEKFAQQDKELKEGIEAKISLENYLSAVRDTIDDERFKQTMGDEICSHIYDKLNDALNWLDGTDKGSKEDYDKCRKEVELVASPEIEDYMNKISGNSQENSSEIKNSDTKISESPKKKPTKVTKTSKSVKTKKELSKVTEKKEVPLKNEVKKSIKKSIKKSKTKSESSVEEKVVVKSKKKLLITKTK